MWYSNARAGNVVPYCWGQEMCYSTVGDRKCCNVMLGTVNVVQYCLVQEMWYSNAGAGNVVQ
jgi:hypothetical protein